MTKRGGVAGLAACLGAIVGAGFASGREVIAFFTRYGAHARWLIALSAGCWRCFVPCVWMWRSGAERAAGGTCTTACRPGCVRLRDCVPP